MQVGFLYAMDNEKLKSAFEKKLVEHEVVTTMRAYVTLQKKKKRFSSYNIQIVSIGLLWKAGLICWGAIDHPDFSRSNKKSPFHHMTIHCGVYLA